MLVVLHTESASWAESARLALVAEGIDCVVLDQFSPGTLGLQGSIRVAITNNSDAERAAAVMKGLEPPTSAPLPSWRWHKWGLLSFVGTIFSFYVSSAIDGDSSRVLRIAVAVGSLGLLVVAIVFFIRGSRADAEHARSLAPAPDDD